MRELVAANHDGDQACYLGNRAGEEGLHCGEAGIERRLRQGKRREKDQQGKEAKAGTKSAQPASEGSLQPAAVCKSGVHRHLQRPRLGRDMP